MNPQEQAIKNVGNSFGSIDITGMTPTQVAAVRNVQKNFATNPQNSTISNSQIPLSTPTPTTNTFKPITAPTGEMESPEVVAARKAQADYLASLSNPNEDTIYQDTLSKFQSQIDAVNSQYADELARAKITGTGRLGSQTAISARRGLIGSDFGEASFQNQENANQEVYKSIENEKAAKIQAIMSGAKTDAAEQYRQKREEFTKGLDARLAFYSEADTRKANNTNKAIKALLAQGISPQELSPSDLNAIAKYYGITVDDINANYATEKKTFDDAEAERLAKLVKDEPNKPTSVQEYEYAVTNGYTGTFNDYQTLDANRKVSIAKAGASSGSSDGLTPYQQFSATQSLAKDTQTRTAGAREMARQAQLIDNSYKNIIAGGDRSLNTQAIITSFNKILDPTSVVRESEYDRTAQGQSLLSQLEGKVQNIAAGGAGVTPATLKEASDIAKKYLEGAQASINEQNARAQSIAQQFGLNPSFVTGTYQEPTSATITAPDGNLIEIID